MYIFTLEVYDQSGDDGNFTLRLKGDSIEQCLKKAKFLIDQYSENDAQIMLDRVVEIEQIV